MTTAKAGKGGLPYAKDGREDYWNCGAMISYYYDATMYAAVVPIQCTCKNKDVSHGRSQFSNHYSLLDTWSTQTLKRD
tara:strand:+ start:441 stop:674 length:234 start_codon:yes stop_codon:yes gene_type:complete